MKHLFKIIGTITLTFFGTAFISILIIDKESTIRENEVRQNDSLQKLKLNLEIKLLKQELNAKK
jgi:hypothetical protein